MISSIDVVPSGHEMWIADINGGVTHLDLREDKSKGKWYQLSNQKIGCVSVNPTRPNFLLTASNTRELRFVLMFDHVLISCSSSYVRIWDSRKLHAMVSDLSLDESTIEFDSEVVTKYRESKKGAACLRGEWRHDKSVSSAYWDPRGRSIVSTSYDNSIRRKL